MKALRSIGSAPTGRRIGTWLQQSENGRAVTSHRISKTCLPTAVVLLLTILNGLGAERSEWKNIQQLDIAQPGLIKLSLPVDSLHALRPGLEDLRIVNAEGQEVPFLIERAAGRPAIARAPKKFEPRMEGRATVLTITTGIAEPLDSLTLETPATGFIKAVTVEGSTDRQTWQPLVTGQPIFRQPTGASQLRIGLPAGVWPFLRVTVDDRRAEAVPLTGVSLTPTTGEPAAAEEIPAKLVERTDDGQTRLTLDLGAAHLTVAALRLETSDPLFTRAVSIAVRQVAENAITERVLARDTVFRVNVEGYPSAERLEIPLDLSLTGRELLVLIDNGDSQPLQISAIHVTRRPVYAVFLAQQPGRYQVLTGNPRCAAPRYDIAALAGRLKGAVPAPVSLTALAGNPAYQPAEPFPEIQDLGSPLDVTPWGYRKPVTLARASVQQLDLDLDVLSKTTSYFGDLRLVRDGKQRPYVLERTTIARKLVPEISRVDDPKRPAVSRWQIKLPQPGLPVTRLTCTTTTPLFRRPSSLFEEPADERGEKYHRELGAASWVRTPPATREVLELTINSTPLTDTLWLEIENGDNSAIQLADFQFYYPVMRLLFKAPGAPQTYLYYGNRRASFPQYDLDLIAPQLLAEEKSPATLGAAEPLKKTSWGGAEQTTPTGNAIFWVVLGAVVIILLVVIVRLLPKTPPAG